MKYFGNGLFWYGGGKPYLASSEIFLMIGEKLVGPSLNIFFK